MKTVKPINSTNMLGKKRKKPKGSHKKDAENILSKDIDVEEEMKAFERMGEKKIVKPREELAQPTFTVKNLQFKPQKYKGNYLPYHLRWIFNNNVRSNEIVLIHEIEALENEISRLKKLKLVNRECRKIADLPFGITTNVCPCCHKLERKKHECTHQFCNSNKCAKKRTEELMNSLLSAQKNNQNIQNISENENLKTDAETNNKKREIGFTSETKLNLETPLKAINQIEEVSDFNKGMDNLVIKENSNEKIVNENQKETLNKINDKDNNESSKEIKIPYLIPE